MRLKRTLWPMSILVTLVVGQEINIPQTNPDSSFSFDTPYNPSSTANPNLNVNPYNPYSTQEPRYGVNDPNVPVDPYGQNDPYGSSRGEYGPYNNDQYSNNGRTPWRNNVYDGGRTPYDTHSSIIREA